MSAIDPNAIAHLSPEMKQIYVQSVTADRKPIEAAEARKKNMSERLGLLNDVLGKVENVRKLIPNFNSPFAIREFTVASSDDKAIVGTADKSQAEVGKHSFEVLQLAKSSTAMSNGFANKDDTKIGTGYFTFNGPNGQTKEVFVDNENGTLEGLAKIINTSGVGMKASVINDQTNPDAPYRLLLSAEGAGAGAEVEYPEFYFVDGDEDFFIDVQKPATNAKIRYQGFDIETPSNEVKDLITGVTLNLKGLSDLGKPVGVSVEQDIPKTTVKIKELVDNVNQVFTFIQSQNKVDEKSNTAKTLGGDYGIRMAEQRMRAALQQGAFVGFGSSEPGAVRSLADVGIQFNKRGTLDFDEKKFQNALTANFDGVTSLLAGTSEGSGVMPKLSAALASVAQPGTGVLANQRQTYTEKIARMDNEIKQKEKTADRRGEILREKLARIQASFSKMQGQQSLFSGADSSLAMLQNATR